MKTYSSALVSLAAYLCVSCSVHESPAAPVDLNEPSVAAENTSKKPDMKAMFGQDYEKGDIGHSKGMITEVDASTGLITINHSTVHGTSIESAVSRFETLPGTKNITLKPSDQVEFLLKKGDDNKYRVLKICTIMANETGCL